MALKSILNDDTLVGKITKHGCHCALLDPALKVNRKENTLGGITTLDDLDIICRNWHLARNCNDKITGGSCHDKFTNFMHYGIFYDVEKSDSVECSCSKNRSCEIDACKIDVYYSFEILNYLETYFPNGDFQQNRVKYNDFDTCILSHTTPHRRTCVGQAPFLKIKLEEMSEEELARHTEDNHYYYDYSQDATYG